MSTETHFGQLGLHYRRRRRPRGVQAHASLHRRGLLFLLLFLLLLLLLLCTRGRVHQQAPRLRRLWVVPVRSERDGPQNRPRRVKRGYSDQYLLLLLLPVVFQQQSVLAGAGREARHPTMAAAGLRVLLFVPVESRSERTCAGLNRFGSDGRSDELAQPQRVVAYGPLPRFPLSTHLAQRGQQDPLLPRIEGPFHFSLAICACADGWIRFVSQFHLYVSLH